MSTVESLESRIRLLQYMLREAETREAELQDEIAALRNYHTPVHPDTLNLCSEREG